ncbi:hypothetical protein Q8A67_012756 [Cirrhinus molitorella]|nr:hypothetical protein Q8A67_012756 [Cirrhinus molitorella]
MAQEADFMRSVLPVHRAFYSEDSSLALPQRDKLALADTHRLNRLQQQVQLTLSRKRKKAKPTASSLSDSLFSCHISSSSSLGSLHLKRIPVNHEATRLSRMVDRPLWSSTEPPPFHRGYRSFRYTAKKPPLCWGSNSLTLPSAPTVNRFHMNTQTLRYAHSEVLRTPRFAGLSGVTQLPSNPVYENNDMDDTDDVFLPDTPHNAPAERNRMESEKHTLQRTFCKPREGGFGAQEQSENVSWQSRIRKPSLELVAGRQPSQQGSLNSMEDQSGSLRRIDKVEVKQHAMTASTKKVRQAELGPEMTLKEAVNLLAQDKMEAQITAANFIQNQCFNSPDAKKKILHLKGIPKLLKLMQSESEELQRASVGALRNIVFENNDNKMEVKDCEGLPMILRLLKKNRDIETRRQLTGLLWNLSSHDLLKEQLAREAVKPLTDGVLVPCSGISEGEDPKLELLADPDIFYNATGCLRNLSSAGPDGRKAMRDCEGLIECVIYYIRGTIADYKPDDKATENCVCILHNLTYRFDCELPRVDSPLVQQSKQNHNGETSNPGCFILNSPKNADEVQEADVDYPLLEENGSPHGVEWLWSAITIRMYLSLIAVSTNQHTKEASIGALQNLTACSGETSQAIAHFIVQKEGGLSQVKKMLQEGEKEEIRISVSLLKNISRYQELHADIVKQVLPELIAILPNSDQNVEQPIDVTVIICHILISLSHASVPNTRAIINQGALPKIISISSKDNGFGPTRAGQAACILLHTLWRHSELHSSFKKAGYRKADFINNRTVKAVNSVLLTFGDLTQQPLTMPLNDERPTSTSTVASEDQSSDTESSERCDSLTSSSDVDCSRQSFTSDSSSKHNSPSCSPPKTLTLDEVMASARDLSNLSLAHEIVVNRNFHLEPPDLPQNSLEKRVKDMVHKAFWDCLESELNDDPPEYDYAIKLLEEIRVTLLSFLNPGANRLRTQIMEVLDMDLIRQQADNNAVDIQGLVSYIINTMGKFCAPVRDDEIKKLKENSGNLVTLFKEIFRVLDLMKMDMVNFTIQSLRPELQRQSVEYERAKFQSILERTPNALDHTTEWIKSSIEEATQAMPPAEKSSNSGQSSKPLPGPTLVLNTAYIRLLTWDESKGPLPETVMTDEVRLQEMQRSLQLYQAVASVLLIVYSSIGGAVSGLPALVERLKKMTAVLLEGMHSADFNLTEALGNVSAQICCEVNKSLAERNSPALPAELQETLKGQICDITQENNPIRTLVEGRLQQYFRVVLASTNSHKTPPPVPPGLGLIQPELTALGLNFVNLVNFNKKVYGPFYVSILKNLLFIDMQAPTPQNGIIKGPPGSPLESK